jgi:hypothetical protein
MRTSCASVDGLLLRGRGGSREQLLDAQRRQFALDENELVNSAPAVIICAFGQERSGARVDAGP